MKSGNLNFLEPSGPLQACNGTALRLCDSAYKEVDCGITELFLASWLPILMYPVDTKSFYALNHIYDCLGTTERRAEIALYIIIPDMITSNQERDRGQE